MATTTKREKKVKVEPKKEEKLPPLPIEEETPAKAKEYLDPSHLSQLEIMSKEVEISRLQMAVEEQELHNLLLSMEVLKSNIEKKRQMVSTKASRYEASKAKFSSYKKEIWPVYDLKENEALGYDPISGLIHRN